MSESGSGTSVITTPSGGGAVQGMGEKFSPDLFTGTGNFSVPISLPPGRHGFQPDLTIVYSSGNGAGAFGLGWNLSIPGITRKTSKGVPLYDDNKDVFILSGAEDLVEVSREAIAHGYKASFQPRTEGLFARIERYKTTTDDYWKVWSKDGLVSYYGTPGQANSQSTYNDPATCADPENRNSIFQWMLSKTTDVFGNVIVYSYLRDNRPASFRADDPHQWDMLYLSQINYADYVSGPDLNFMCMVQFNYVDRPDQTSTYKQGFEMRLTKRCTSIETFTIPAGMYVLTKTYYFIYLDERVAAGDFPASVLPANGHSLLNRVAIQGHDGDADEFMPPLEFGYTSFNPLLRDFEPVTGRDLPPSSLASRDYELADVFGNGLPDIVQLNGLARYWKNLGNGSFDLPRNMKNAPAGAQLSDPNVQLMDADGDGKLDLFVNKQGQAGYFPMQHDGLWANKQFIRYKYIPSFSLSDPEVKLIDMDGDGVTDVLRNGSRLECFLNDPVQGFYKVITTEKKRIGSFPNVSFADPRIRTADMSGDSMQDIVMVGDGRVDYWPNMGYGKWGAMVSMKNSPRFPYRFNSQQIYLGDLDGDGLADMVYVENNQVTLWINQGGQSWSDPIVIKGTPALRDVKAVRLADIKGTGVCGLLWTYDYFTNPNRSTMFFLDLTGGVKPYVLNEMDNNMGALTKVEYKSSTEYFLRDQARVNNQSTPGMGLGGEIGVLPDGRLTPWKTTLPFPVQVVSKVTVIDAISGGKLSTEYSYHHGYWDGGEREFRGFGRVHQRDTESFTRYNSPVIARSDAAGGATKQSPSFEAVDQIYYTPPTETISWFHLGPVGDERGDWQEVYFADEYWQEDPQVLQRPSEMITMINGLPRRARRDAYRTLRGSLLRSEMYALDGTSYRNRPYTVSENLQGVRLEYSPPVIATKQSPSTQPYGPDENNKQGSGYIFFAHALSSRSSQWERGIEPMTSFSFTENYDIYGTPQTQISVAVPRGKNAVANDPLPAVPYLATMSQSVFASRDEVENGFYLIGRPVSSKSYEVENDGSLDVFTLKAHILAGSTSNDLLSHSLTYYDGTAFTGAAYGVLGDYGVPVRSEALYFTDSLLDDIYGSSRPPYIKETGSPTWTSDYLSAFRTALPANAGYTYFSGTDDIHEAGYYCNTDQKKFDFHDDPFSSKGLVLQMKDPLGNTASVDYDDYLLLPIKVTDAAGMETLASYDYRVMQADLITDPNLNRVQFAFSPLGFLIKTAVMGKSTESLGDTLAVPGTLMEYDFFAFVNDGLPVYVKTTAREHHYYDSINDDTIVSVQYSDGFGRLIQSRTQAEEVIFGDSIFGDSGLDTAGVSDTDPTGVENTDPDNLNVVVSGWQVYNNKGKVVEKYEPYYDQGFDFLSPSGGGQGEETARTALSRSQKIKMFYDPRGQLIRTVNPDSTEQRVVLGIPKDLTTPDVYTPTPWESYSYDANDLKLLTNPTDSTVPSDHYYTPSNSVIDALGRTIKTIDRNCTSGVIEEIVMQYEYDIRGNLLTVTDPLNRTTFTHEYDLANRPLKTTHIDGGTKYTVLDCMSKPVEMRDQKGALTLSIYDNLNRPTKSWARDKTSDTATLRHKSIYGDDAGLTNPENENLKGKIYKQYDEAGLTTIASYDFKGNPLEKTRKVIKDSELTSVFAGPPASWAIDTYKVDWNVSTDSILDSTDYTTSLEYDALNRVTKMTYPEDVGSERKILLPTYNRSGALDKVDLKDNSGATAVNYVERIAYNARGQKILTALGNGTMTRYEYRTDNFRLLRMKSEKYDNSSNPLIYVHQSGTIKQNFTYQYDLIGNIINLTDTTTGCGPGGSNSLGRNFGYDALYRLLSATGRETASTGTTPWADFYRPDNNTISRFYTQNYNYDKLGNIQTLVHTASSGNFTRTFSYISGKNKLDTIAANSHTYNYTHDVNGNIIQEDSNRFFTYDYADRLKSFFIQAGTSEPSIYSQYFYDAAGTRIKKITRTQYGGIKTTVYIDGIFEHTKEDAAADSIPNLIIGSWVVGSTIGGEQNILHIMDGSSRVATKRIGDALGDTTPDIKYYLEDHLGSSNLVLSTTSSLISAEEYYPFGETSFGSYSKKRYRYNGKEKDEESGLYYFNARYYNAWTCRFMSIDPMALKNSNKTPYNYCSNNPINRVDPSGMDDGPKGGGKGTQNHSIKKGDTLWGLAKKYNTTVSNLKKINELDSNKIIAGGTLKVPEQGGEKDVVHGATAPKHVSPPAQAAKPKSVAEARVEAIKKQAIKSSSTGTSDEQRNNSIQAAKLKARAEGNPVGDFIDRVLSGNWEGTHTEDHSTSSSSAGGVNMTKTSGQVYGGSPVVAKNVTYADISEFTNMIGVGGRGASTAGLVIQNASSNLSILRGPNVTVPVVNMEALKNAGEIVNTGIDYVQQGLSSDHNATSTPLQRDTIKGPKFTDQVGNIGNTEIIRENGKNVDTLYYTH